MDEKVICFVVAGAMLSVGEKDSEIKDLLLIEGMLFRASSSNLAEGNCDNSRFVNDRTISDDGETSLRIDKIDCVSGKNSDESLLNQSKRFEGTYNSVPRVV